MPNTMNNYTRKQKEYAEARKRKNEQLEKNFGKVRVMLANGTTMPAVNYFKQQQQKNIEKGKKNPPGDPFFNGGKRRNKTRKGRKGKKGTRKH